MAVVSRVATLRFDNGLGSFRQWQVTAAVQDTAEGGSVAWSLAETSGGTPPGAADTLTVRFKDASGAVIVSSTAASGTFHFTDTGAGGGSARHGTVLIDIQATRTSLGTYDYETDGSPSSAPAGFSAATVDRGYTRGTTAVVEDISNVSLGGAETAPAEHDESLFVRLTLGSASYVARALSVALSHGSVSGNTSSTASATRDVTFSNVVDDRFPAASTDVGMTVTPPNDATTGQPYTVFTSTTDDSMLVDPRLTAQYHFQKGGGAFDVQSHDTSFQMLTSDTGKVATRFKTARTASGVNGLQGTVVATPAQNPSQAVTLNFTAATRDGEAGWTEQLEICPTGKPGGAWDCAADITSPADIDNNAHLLSGTQAVLVLADDPSLALRVEAGDPSRPDDHWKIGDQLVVGMAMSRRTKTNGVIGMTRLALDSGTGKFLVGSFNYALARLETLASDGVTWEYVGSPYLFSTAASPGDAWLNLYTFAAATTLQWGANRGGYFVQGGGESGGVYKAGGGKVDSLGIANLHSKWHILREAIG